MHACLLPSCNLELALTNTHSRPSMRKSSTSWVQWVHASCIARQGSRPVKPRDKVPGFLFPNRSSIGRQSSANRRRHVYGAPDVHSTFQNPCKPKPNDLTIWLLIRGEMPVLHPMVHEHGVLIEVVL